MSPILHALMHSVHAIFPASLFFFSTSLNQITLNNSYREITWCRLQTRLVVKLVSFLPLFWNVLS